MEVVVVVVETVVKVLATAATASLAVVATDAFVIEGTATVSKWIEGLY